MLNTVFLGQSCPKTLQLDRACLEVHSTIPRQLDLWHQYDECHLCDVEHWTTILPNGTVTLLVDTAFSSYFYYTENDKSKLCLTKGSFNENGIYGWNISEGTCSNIWTIKPPSSHFYLPLVVALCIYTIISILMSVAKCIYEQGWSARVWLRNVAFSELENDLGSPPTRETSTTVARIGSTRRLISGRIQSLDTFRGICIVMMIFVNYGGGQYRFFHHAPWNGMTVADVIFPWFLWVMGMSLVISLRSQLRSDRSRYSVWLTAVRRCFMLVMFGLLLNSYGQSHNDLPNFRFAGVLQRIGASYFIIASIETLFLNLQGPSEYGLLNDLCDGWVQWLCAIALVGVWAMITFLMNVPNCGSGYLGPGGLHAHSKYVNCTGGAAGYIDQLILTPQHMYRRPTCRSIYQNTQPFDPEGLLGTLTAAFLVHLGVHASRILLCYEYWKCRISRWIFWGFVAIFVGGMMCGFHKEDGYIPINKNLFSLSFVLVTGGLAYLVFALLYYVIDYRKWWTGFPFRSAGMNSILLYVGHEITKHMFPWSWKPFVGTHGEFLTMNLIGTTLWIIVAWALYKKKFFLSV